MAALDDYIAQLLSGVANARLQADLESVRIAQLYAQHPLLQHLPIPRFRLPTVTLDMPVAIDKGDDPAKAVVPGEIHQELVAALDQTLQEQQLTRQPRGRAPAIRSLSVLVNELMAQPEVTPLAVGQGIERVVSVSMEMLRSSLRAEGKPVLGELETTLRQRATAVMTRLLPQSRAVQLVVQTSQLKDIGPTAHLTRIQLTVTEEGVEWTQSNPDDPQTRKLILE